MSNLLQVFNYQHNEVRTIIIDGEPWWVAKDVCDVFGETNRNRAMQALHEDEKGYTQMTTPRGVQNIAIINESGLYSLLFAMQPSKARGVSADYIAQRESLLHSFRRWVTHDVLPSIRKTGLYATPDVYEKILSDPDFLIEALMEKKAVKAKNAAFTETINIQNQQIAEMRPKAGYYDVILACKDAVSITKIAKDYGKSGKWLNDYLHKLGIQYKHGDIWLIYQKHAENGYTCTRTHTYTDNSGEQRSRVQGLDTKGTTFYIRTA